MCITAAALDMIYDTTDCNWTENGMASDLQQGNRASKQCAIRLCFYLATHTLLSYLFYSIPFYSAPIHHATLSTTTTACHYARREQQH